MKIEISVIVLAPIDTVWDKFTKPEHITHWNFASPEWHCPSAINNLKVGGDFSWRMEAKDGSFGFDYEGIYTELVDRKLIRYKLADERGVEVRFESQDDKVQVTEIFDSDDEHNEEQQREGWLAILNNFKSYVEG